MKKIFTVVIFTVACLLGDSSEATERLLLVGGGKLPADAVEKFVKHANKEFGRILIVGWASRGPEIAVQDFQEDIAPFFKGTVDASYYAPTHELERFRFLNQLSLASAVWFVGGDQQRIMFAFSQAGGEQLKEALVARLKEGVIIGGTSAGTAIMSNPMIIGGDSSANVQLDEGLGLAHSVDAPFILDQHFSQRKREDRLVGAMKLAGINYGLGVDEETAVLIIDRTIATAIGLHRVRAFELANGEVKEVSLKNGERFNLDLWKKKLDETHSSCSRMSLTNFSQ